MIVQRELTDRDGVNIRVGQIEIFVVLFDQAGFIPRDIHLLRDLAPADDFRLLQRRFLRQSSKSVRRVPAHGVQGFHGGKQAALPHVIGVGVVVHHHVEFVWPHHAEEAVFARFPALFHAAGQITGDLQQHFCAVGIQKFPVTGHMRIVPDAVGNRRAGLHLQAGVLPEGAGLIAIQGSDRVAGPLAIQHLCPFQGLGQRVITE